MIRRIEFSIDALPPSLNKWSRRHWSVRHQVTRDWGVWIAHFGPKPDSHGWPGGEPIDPAVVTLEFRSVYRLDVDNRAKFVLDGLVKAGIIKDDAIPHLAELRLRGAKGKPRTYIIVEHAD